MRRTVQDRLWCLSLPRCGVVWGNNSSLGCRSVVLLQRAGRGNRTTRVTCDYCSTRCRGAIQDQGGPREETGGGWAWGGARTGRKLGRGRSSSLSLLFEMMFVLWHSAASIVISHNIMGRLAPWPAGWLLIKGKKKPWIYSLPSETFPCLSTPCGHVFLAYPDISLSFIWPFHWSLVPNVYSQRGG